MSQSKQRSQIIEQLERLDLSDKEIETYLEILDLGKGTASEIADNADISRRYVYSLVEELEDHGFVKVHDYTEPRIIESRPPLEVIDEIVGDLEAVGDLLSRRYDENPDEMITFDVIKSRQTALKQLRGMIGDAEEELFLVAPKSTFDELRPALSEAIDRDVSIYLLKTAGNRQDLIENTEQYEGAATVVRHWGEPTPFVLARDNRAGMIGDHDLIAGSRPEADSISVVERRLTTALFGSYVSGFWQMGEEIYLAPPRDLPLTYHQIRPAAIQAILHVARDQPIKATATAVPLNGNRKRKITGDVVEVIQGLVAPTTNDFPLEYGLKLQIGADEVRVGGEGAFLEDYRALDITLHE
ncbi:TrmB family transcriptional regulator sugar-binding domain-containing protein [Halorhabdus salina]|uniref:TrmB family transcriptional regulator sugar-binding domain-containing protein n=1 Tax=Halorhabdus salina TaxID=2750670 RepID=UPI0015EE97BA|nr:TrmB family transcriptional regulator sugar-binding domain-containing protein [Halorhabdus salina]